MVQSCPTLATPWTVVHQAPLSMGFSRQEYWSGLPFPSPGDLPNPGIEPGTFALQVDSLLTELQGKPEFGLTQLSQARSSNLDKNDPCYPGPPHALKSILNPSSAPSNVAQPMESFPSSEFPTALILHHTGEVENVCPDWIFPGISSPCLCWSNLSHRPISQTVKLRS